jgi:hypothetical protein
MTLFSVLVAAAAKFSSFIKRLPKKIEVVMRIIIEL